jgi:hypothetical protein
MYYGRQWTLGCVCNEWLRPRCSTDAIGCMKSTSKEPMHPSNGCTRGVVECIIGFSGSEVCPVSPQNAWVVCVVFSILQVRCTLGARIRGAQSVKDNERKSSRLPQDATASPSGLKKTHTAEVRPCMTHTGDCKSRGTEVHAENSNTELCTASKGGS